jgi:alcohol dehydrogenase class IV
MVLKFVHDALPGRVVFGAGSLERLPDEVARLGARRVLLVSTPGHRDLAEDAARRLGARAAGIWDQARMHAPIENAQVARAEARRLGADACVALGGGTPIGLAKAIALELGLPIVAVPTTYAGSEMTPVLGITEAGVKRTRRDPKMLPKTVIYDPELTFSLPAAVSGPSGMNAIAHCVEALYAQDANPLASLIAEEGIRALAWRCTTSFATCSAALSTCPTPRCTRSSCRTRPRTTAPARPRQWRGSRARSPPRTRRRAFSTSPPHSAPSRP